MQIEMSNIGYITCLFFVLLISLRPHEISSRDLPKSSNLIVQTCDATMYKDLCRSTLTSLPDSDKADLHQLARKSLRYAALNGSSIDQKFTELLRDEKEDEFSEQCFHDCSQNYDDAAEQLEDSIVAIDEKRYTDVETWILAAMSAVETCAEGCNQNSSLDQMNIGFKQLCSNTLVIVNMLSV